MTERPHILPGMLADIMNSAPARLQKKLDQDAMIADQWIWKSGETEWRVEAGGECVSLKTNPVAGIDEVECSCLLSPRCFHVLAVLNVLSIAADDQAAAVSDPFSACMEPQAELFPRHTASQPDTVPETIGPGRAAAAALMFQQCASVLSAGFRAAGTVLQSGLLRAIHECRAEGLHRLAAAGLRVMQNIRSLRSGSDTFQSSAAEDDLREALEVAWRLSRADGVEVPELIGVARRRYEPVQSLKLHGLYCEPILTRSGYSGVVTYLMAEDGWIGSVSDVQPGDAARIPQAWKSGVSLAGLALSHQSLSRQCLLISQATRSADGRIGGSDSARAVVVPGVGWEAAPIARAFQRSLSEQVDRAFRQRKIPATERPAGSDLIFVRGTVLGCSQSELLLQVSDCNTPLRCSIAIDHDALRFRDNLALLARAPGLPLRCLTRLCFDVPGQVSLLAIASDDQRTENELQNVPVLRFPTEMMFHADLGLDSVQRAQLSTAERFPVEVQVPPTSITPQDDLLSRWLQAIVVGGRHAVPSGKVTSAIRDAAMLKQQLRPTSAALLHSLTQAAISTQTDVRGVRFPNSSSELAQHWLATAVARQTADQHLQQQQWLQSIGME